jgi:hypothetical protein
MSLFTQMTGMQYAYWPHIHHCTCTWSTLTPVVSNKDRPLATKVALSLALAEVIALALALSASGSRRLSKPAFACPFALDSKGS